MLRVPSLAVPLSKTQDSRPVSTLVRSMLKEPALGLHHGPEDLLAVGVLLPAPVAPKLLRDRAEDRLGVGGLPLCHSTLRPR